MFTSPYRYILVKNICCNMNEWPTFTLIHILLHPRNHTTSHFNSPYPYRYLPLPQGAGDVALRALHLLWKLQDDAAAAAAQTTPSPAKKLNEVNAPPLPLPPSHSSPRSAFLFLIHTLFIPSQSATTQPPIISHPIISHPIISQYIPSH